MICTGCEARREAIAAKLKEWRQSLLKKFNTAPAPEQKEIQPKTVDSVTGR